MLNGQGQFLDSHGLHLVSVSAIVLSSSRRMLVERSRCTWQTLIHLWLIISVMIPDSPHQNTTLLSRALWDMTNAFSKRCDSSNLHCLLGVRLPWMFSELAHIRFPLGWLVDITHPALYTVIPPCLYAGFLSGFLLHHVTHSCISSHVCRWCSLRKERVT